jgi:predicted MPP superfamily phosphohydrolase
MPPTSVLVSGALRGAVGAAAVGVGCLAYAGLYEINAFRLRRVEAAVLPPGAAPLRVLHISDLHLTPYDRARQAWVSRLAGLEPDLVIDTGDNLASADAVPYVRRTLGRLLDVPGVFVWGSNDYFAPSFKNPLLYLTRPERRAQIQPVELPWRDLRRDFSAAGWVELTNSATTMTLNGLRIGFRGTDDAHLGQDRYVDVAGPVDRGEIDLAVGVTHAPYSSVIDPMTADGLDLIVAGHTHGGQLCVPFYGALVTNCDLDVARVKGLSTNTAGGHTAALHVSAGLGASPYARIRFACPPEATLLTLVGRQQSTAMG